MKPANFPGRKEVKRKEALERQSAHDVLSDLEKLAKLDKKLGLGKGAKKERAKLAKRLSKVMNTKGV